MRLHTLDTNSIIQLIASDYSSYSILNFNVLLYNFKVHPELCRRQLSGNITTLRIKEFRVLLQFTRGCSPNHILSSRLCPLKLLFLGHHQPGRTSPFIPIHPNKFPSIIVIEISRTFTRNMKASTFRTLVKFGISRKKKKISYYKTSNCISTIT